MNTRRSDIPHILISLVLAWLMLVLLAAMVSAQTVTVYCPPMRVERLSLRPNLWQCAREVGTARIDMPDGSTIHFDTFTIESTLVRKNRIGHTVDACSQVGFSSANGWRLDIELPPERVILGLAEAMYAPLTLTKADGTTCKGHVVYGSSQSRRKGFGVREAAAVYAYGEVMLP